MNRCENCGTEFEGKFCPECGARWGSASCHSCGAEVKAETKFCPECGEPIKEAEGHALRKSEPTTADRRHILFQVVSWLPPVLLALMSALCFAFFAAPVIVRNGLLGSEQLNVYDVLDNMLLGNMTLSTDLSLIFVAFVFFAALGLLLGFVVICYRFKGIKNKAVIFVEIFIYLSLMIISIVTILKVKQFDNEFSGGLGVITAGSCPTLIIVCSVLFLTVSVAAAAMRVNILKRNPSILSDIATLAEQKNRLPAMRWISSHLKLIVPLSFVLVVAVVLLSLIPTFKRVSVSGVYYKATGNGSYDYNNYVVLTATKKWKDEAGNSGRYEMNGQSITLYHKEAEFGIETQLNGAVENKVLILKSPNGYQKFVRTSHEHQFKEWETTNEPTCVEEGLRVAACACGYIETKSIPATGHNGFATGQCITCKQTVLSYELSDTSDYYIVTGYSKFGINDWIDFDKESINDTYFIDICILNEYNGLPVKKIALGAFWGSKWDLEWGYYGYYIQIKGVKIPIEITEIDAGAFAECRELKDIYYEGTIEQWNAIKKCTEYEGGIYHWDLETGDYTVHCTDGEIKKGE